MELWIFPQCSCMVKDVTAGAEVGAVGAGSQCHGVGEILHTLSQTGELVPLLTLERRLQVLEVIKVFGM